MTKIWDRSLGTSKKQQGVITPKRKETLLKRRYDNLKLLGEKNISMFTHKLRIEANEFIKQYESRHKHTRTV